MTKSELGLLREAIEAARAGCERDGVSSSFLATRAEGDELVLAGNRCGLLHLAARLVEYAERPGDHFHLDAASELDECAQGIVVSHVENPW